MKEFGRTQTMLATEHPSWIRFWNWGQTYQPNKEEMWHWAIWRLRLCDEGTKDCNLDGKSTR
jgi:hypothetical protein